MSYDITVETPISCADIADVQLMNMSSRTAAAPPLPIMVCAATKVDELLSDETTS